MSCDTIEPELTAYHFGVVEPEARERIEAHLLGCSACLRSFLTLKRDIETGEEEPAPSQASRQRLRQAVLLELGGASPRPWRRWERPFAFGFAGAAVVVAVLAVQALSAGPGEPPRGFPPAAHSPARAP